MTANLLVECLKNPARLYQLSATELRSLAAQYPFAQNIHLLLWEKSLQEDKRDAGKLLEKAAAYSPNRRLLFQKWQQQAQKETPEQAWLLNEEEVLELKALSALIPQPLPRVEPETPLEAAPAQIEWPIAANPTTSGFVAFSDHELEDEDLFLAVPEADVEPQPAPAASFSWPERKLESISSDLAAAADAVGGFLATRQLPPPIEPTLDLTPPEILPEENTALIPEPEPADTLIQTDYQAQVLPPEPADAAPIAELDPVAPIVNAPKPLGKEQFASWRSRQPAVARIPKSAAELHDPEVVAAVIAKKSVAENEHIGTETLADLLARQGQYEKAIKMYERLSLKFPEKSTYFAAKIEQLKNI